MGANRKDKYNSNINILGSIPDYGLIIASVVKPIVKQQVDELLTEGYAPKLDDGVGKNINPLQKKGMLSYEVLNAGQLKKYLNADW